MGKDEMMKKSTGKKEYLRAEGNKVYVDIALLREIMEARKEVLKELAKR
jgi:hypothetical protein